jgi:hypothetical protein
MTFPAREGGADVLADEVRGLLERGRRTPDLDADERLAERLVSTALGLGLAVGHSPWLRDTEAVARLRATGPDGLRPLLPGLSLFVLRLDLELRSSFEWGDEWEDAARRRSGLRFLFDMLGIREDDELLDGLGLDEVDARLRARGEFEGGGAAPEGVPESHWWWRCGPG